MVIKKIKEEDYVQIAEIYLQGILSGHATFETQAPSWQEWRDSHLLDCSLAAFDTTKMLGWAALSPTSKRYAYRGVAEVSVYVSEAYKGKGIGQKLFQSVIEESEKQEIWTIFASIFPENLASLKLHKKMGFREIGYREKVGQMNGVWRNTIILERRSKLVGI